MLRTAALSAAPSAGPDAPVPSADPGAPAPSADSDALAPAPVPSAASPYAARLAAARPWLTAAAMLLVGGLALAAVHALTAEMDYDAVVDAVAGVPPGALAAAVLATALSYAAMVGYDAAALRHAAPDARVPLRLAALASFCAFALGNAVGVGTLTGGAVRWRVYTAAGLEPSRVAGVVAFVALGFGLGVAAVGALGLAFAPDAVADRIGAPGWVPRAAGVAVLAGLAGFVALCAIRRVVRIGRFSVRLPTARVALAQLAVSVLDLAAAALALWALLPAGAVDPVTFLPVYAAAVAAGLASHLPGGIGVFEAVVLLAVRDGAASPERVAAALVLYRAIYYALPLGLAVALLAGFELRRGAAAQPAARALRVLGRLTPRFLGALAFAAGTVLLLGGILPSGEESPGLLAAAVPGPVREASHLLSSVGGIALLLVANGLVQRFDAAWWVATPCTLAFLALAVARGGGVPEVATLALLAVALVATRRRFDRRAWLFEQPLTPGWLLAVAAVVGAAGWLLFFAYRDVDYETALWWRFGPDEDASRAMRAALGATVAAGAAGLWALLRPAPGRAERPTPEALARASAIADAQDRADAHLVRGGDKALLFSAAGDAFVMHGRRGRSWIALFGPIGPRRSRADLVWRFVEMASAHGGRAAFYQVAAEDLPLYLDAGLRPVKLGEAARVPLAGFDLKGRARAGLRNAVNRAERQGLTFAVAPPEGVADLLPEVAEVSQAWLAGRSAREKGFSLGPFEPGYLCSLPLAFVRDGTGRMLAFATLIETATSRAEASLDLMRHRPDAPPGTMDFLFARLLLRAKELGYAAFDLGMAPLSGFAAHPLAPAWHRFGGLVFRRGERLYNFRGLRAFKDKFDPVWEPRYLCAQGGIGPWVALADVAALQSGGLKGVIGK